jgi:hypothetical protein
MVAKACFAAHVYGHTRPRWAEKQSSVYFIPFEPMDEAEAIVQLLEH